MEWLILTKPKLPLLSSRMYMQRQISPRLGLITAEAAVCRKEVSNGESHGEVCRRGNGTVKQGSNSASKSGVSGAAAHTGSSGHADVLRPSSKRARTDDVQPPQCPVAGQRGPTDIVNLLPQCTADKSAFLRPPALLTACSVSHAQPAASLPLWLEQVRGVQEQRQQQGPNQASVAQGVHCQAVPLLPHVMHFPRQSVATSMAQPGQPELLPLQEQQPHWTPAMQQPYWTSAVLGQQPLQPCQQQMGGFGIQSFPAGSMQMAQQPACLSKQQPAKVMAMQHELMLPGQQQCMELLQQQLFATVAAIQQQVMQEADAAEKLQQQCRSLQ